LDSKFISQPDATYATSKAHFDQGAPGDDPNRPDTEDNDLLPELIAQLLREGHKVRFRAPGKSMQPAVLDGDVLIVEPIEPAAIKTGDIILYQVEERLIAHRVVSVEKVQYREHRVTGRSCGPSSAHSNSAPDGTTTRPPENLYAFILRGDASYSYDEPVYADQVLGKAITIERKHRSINPYSLTYRLTCRARVWASRIKRIYF
jgi:signal peptidase I